LLKRGLLGTSQGRRGRLWHSHGWAWECRRTSDARFHCPDAPLEQAVIGRHSKAGKHLRDIDWLQLIGWRRYAEMRQNVIIEQVAELNASIAR
jgi:hypothetical protein